MSSVKTCKFACKKSWGSVGDSGAHPIYILPEHRAKRRESLRSELLNETIKKLASEDGVRNSAAVILGSLSQYSSEILSCPCVVRCSKMRNHNEEEII